MTPHRFFYPRVVIEFYQTMTSKGDPNPTALYFTIDGREGILRAIDIAAAFNLLVVLANSAEYRQWPHHSSREMVRILARDTSAGPILFRRQLPPGMLLIDHVLRSNLFPLQHLVHRRGAILKALYRISGGFWFSTVELIMIALFHFEDKIHRKNLSWAEAIPLLFLRQLSQVLEHLGFPTEPQLERCRVCEAVFTIEKWKFVLGAPHLPLLDPVEDHLADDHPVEDQLPPAVLDEEPRPCLLRKMPSSYIFRTIWACLRLLHQYLPRPLQLRLPQ